MGILNKIEKIYFTPEKDGFYGCYYPNPNGSKYVVIGMLGNEVDNYLAISFVKWLLSQGCSVMAMSPDKTEQGHYNVPLERFSSAINWLKNHGSEHIGIAGGSITAMLALIVASYFNEIELTIAFSPCDFVAEGFHRGNKDGAKEWPGDMESTVSYQGKPLPYLPYAYRHPEYWKKIQEESKRSGNMIASREMFKESERLHPIREEEYIKVENIKGKILFIGAEDDCLWDTCSYIRRMKERLESKNATSRPEYLVYKHGTHFVFPESMLKQALPLISGLFVRCCFKAAKEYPKECKNTRIDIDHKVGQAIKEWMEK